MAFCNPCVRPTNSSTIVCAKRSTPSIKSLLRGQLLKKSSRVAPLHRPTSHSNARFQRVHGSNFVREVKPSMECSLQTNSTDNYDMTTIDTDQPDESAVTLSHRRGKKIPRWARKSQLQLAFINQVYFNERNPEDIFGTVRLELAQDMVHSIERRHLSAAQIYASSLCPPNFV